MYIICIYRIIILLPVHLRSRLGRQYPCLVTSITLSATKNTQLSRAQLPSLKISAQVSPTTHLPTYWVDRQTDILTDLPTYWQMTYIPTYWQTYRHTDRNTYILAIDRHTDILTGLCTCQSHCGFEKMLYWFYLQNEGLIKTNNFSYIERADLSVW